MDAPVDLAAAVGLARDVVGGKAGVLAELAAAGFPVPPGFVIPASAAARVRELAEALTEAAERTGPGPFAVRSSAAAEDLPEASYAGLYESLLNVPREGLADAAAHVVAAAADPRVTAYRSNATEPAPSGRRRGPAVAVLVQQMVDAAAAGVAFSADPVTGARETALITAVPGLGDRLVSGEAVGEEWRVRGGRAERSRADDDGPVLGEGEAAAVASLAHRVAAHYGAPQDIEWAMDAARRLHLVQARPMTALPEPVEWTPPGPGLWMRNFRIGEWLGEAMTPLFATWLVPVLEDGYLDGVRTDVGVAVQFRWTAVNGWYYNATPAPSPAMLARVVMANRGRAPWFLFNAVVRVSRNPAAADRAVLGPLARAWGEELLPNYRRQVAAAAADVADAPPQQLLALVDLLGRTAGRYLWSLAIVGGSAWKMEAALTRFCRQHLPAVPAVADGPQVLLRGLPGGAPAVPPHAVHSLDWYRSTAGETADLAPDDPVAEDRHITLAGNRGSAEESCRAALDGRPRLLARFDRLLQVTQRYAVLRELQARDLTLAWPVLRRCVIRLGEHLLSRGQLAEAADVFFLTRDEVATGLADPEDALTEAAERHRATWDRQCRLVAPLTLGRPAPVIGDPIARAVEAARTTRRLPPDAIVGQPASAGLATGPARLIRGPRDFAAFAEGEVLIAATTAPAFTPLFARAAAVVTDSGTLAAHASIIAREYGIPAVVGTGDATHRFRTGQLVTVDGGAGTVTPVHTPPSDRPPSGSASHG